MSIVSYIKRWFNGKSPLDYARDLQDELPCAHTIWALRAPNNKDKHGFLQIWIEKKGILDIKNPIKIVWVQVSTDKENPDWRKFTMKETE